MQEYLILITHCVNQARPAEYSKAFEDITAATAFALSTWPKAHKLEISAVPAKGCKREAQ
ncbi:MAG: hypothetical protein RSE32_07995 [Comamonas sp.]|uniref:hypothetical protein n=1 Tax=Comamonas sp. TaxID=34028 RepID=UPI002FC71314